MSSPSSRRAWIEIFAWAGCSGSAGSPSSRRAWIEIVWKEQGGRTLSVALLAEGVDRNLHWQEGRRNPDPDVALLAEGVDRNLIMLSAPMSGTRRPPRGGRG